MATADELTYAFTIAGKQWAEELFDFTPRESAYGAWKTLLFSFQDIGSDDYARFSGLCPNGPPRKAPSAFIEAYESRKRELRLMASLPPYRCGTKNKLK